MHYVDAVVAVAQTLLILPLTDAAEEADSIHDFFEGQSKIYAGLISFILITFFWSARRGREPNVTVPSRCCESSSPD